MSVVGDCGGSGVPALRKLCLGGVVVRCGGEGSWLLPFTCRASCAARAVLLSLSLWPSMLSTRKALLVAVVTLPFTWWLAFIFILATVFLLWLQGMCGDVSGRGLAFPLLGSMPRGSGSVQGAVCARGPWRPECVLAQRQALQLLCLGGASKEAGKEGSVKKAAQGRGFALPVVLAPLAVALEQGSGLGMHGPVDEAAAGPKRTVPRESNGVVFWDCQSPGLQERVLFRARWSVRGGASLEGMALKRHGGLEDITCEQDGRGWASVAGVAKVCQQFQMPFQKRRKAGHR